MEVEDGRHFRNDLDESSRPADWEVRLRGALDNVKATILQAEHRKERVGKEGTQVSPLIATIRSHVNLVSLVVPQSCETC